MAKIKFGTTLAGALWLEAMTQHFGDDGRFSSLVPNVLIGNAYKTHNTSTHPQAGAWGRE